jgi:hypothetical protein
MTTFGVSSSRVGERQAEGRSEDSGKKQLFHD